MRKKKLSIDYLLKDYGTESEIQGAKELLERFELLELIGKISQIINQKKKNEKYFLKNGNTTQIGGLTASVLAKFNEKIRSVDDFEDKQKLEIILSCVAIAFIEFCIRQFDSPKEQIPLQIIEALYDCSQLYSYRMEDLLRFLNMDQYLSYQKSLFENIEPVIDPRKGLPKFKWKGSREKIKQFIDLLHEHNISSEDDKWKKIFSQNIGESLKIKLVEKDPDEVYTFFIVADILGLFGPENTNGLYKVLQFHCVNFNKIFLKNLEPRERNRRLKARRDWEHSYRRWADILKSVK